MWLRPANKGDALILLQWKNEETVRKYSIVSKKKIRMEEYLNWLDKNLEYIEIIMYETNEVGDVRIKDDEIAIKIAKEYRGKGIGKEVVEMVKEKGMIVKIVKGNESLMKLFIGQGFKVKDFKKGVYTLEYEVHE